MNKANRLTASIFGLVLIITAVFVVIFRKAIYDSILIPLLYLYWLIDLVLEYIGQVIIWIFLLVIVFYIIIRSLALYRPAFPVVETLKSTRMVQGRVISWANITRDFKRYLTMNTYFLRNVEKLVLEVLADGRGWDSGTSRQINLAELDEVPDEVKAALTNLKLSTEAEHENWFSKIKKALTAPISTKQASNPQGSVKDLETILFFLERHLEILHDNDDR